MSDQIISSVVAILTAIVGLAVLAVLVSSRAQTSQVVRSVGTAFAQDLSAAVSPVTGGGGFTGAGTGFGPY
jgi:hypothetical protein